MNHRKLYLVSLKPPLEKLPFFISFRVFKALGNNNKTLADLYSPILYNLKEEIYKSRERWASSKCENIPLAWI